MEPQDDPEQRIRDLERPLEDTARASELSSPPPGGHAYPPPPGPVPPPASSAPYSYGGYGGLGGGPYAGPTPKSSSGSRALWILGAVFVVGVLALVGGIAAFVAHRISQSHIVIQSPTPSISMPPTGPTSSRTKTRTPSSAPSTPSTASGTSGAPAGAPLSISGINEDETLACNDNTVTVSGISNTITITGHCKSLTVSGMKNSVTVDAADTIEASGLNNEVTYHTGTPQVSKSGEGNVVQQG
ncbi:MAG: DUF3060 domain-containing protein [Mycobacterium sp.]|uniref:DUF3060 domain-containing protein n=1 Tax=Mycobacterium sp. TaxID=1785 RepID=UPI001EB5A900|nr:DUF3060 domain-containing protein [Mycobacterium sp.]MBW0017852.1 DUF3060 domain-containing protein [Mycobacterium sp.]